MDKRLQVLIAVAIVAAAVILAVVTRYEYVHLAGARIRIDRWTGARQMWECSERSALGDAILKGRDDRTCKWVRR